MGMMEASPSTKILTDSSSPLVSIIVPSYNYGQFIYQMLESVLAQTYHNWECIIVDDGSTDDTREIVLRLAAADGRIRYIRQKNQGQPAALNTGLRNFAGEYLQILDADDLLENRKLERQIEYLQSHPEVDIVYGDARYFTEQNTHERLYSMWGGNQPWMPELSGAGVQVLQHLVRANIMPVNTPLIQRRTVETVGPFDETLAPLHDWDYWLRCAANGNLFDYFKAEGTMALVRIHSASMSKNQRRMYLTSLTLRKKISVTLEDEGLLDLNRQWAAEMEKLIRDEDIWCALEHIKSGLWPRAMREFVKIGLGSQSYHEAVKWFFCAAVAPFAPRENFHTIVATPMGGSIVKILRYHLGGRRYD
jgi:glycosyltransferase involved in cell wall biosynthesis